MSIRLPFECRCICVCAQHTIIHWTGPWLLCSTQFTYKQSTFKPNFSYLRRKIRFKTENVWKSLQKFATKMWKLVSKTWIKPNSRWCWIPRNGESKHWTLSVSPADGAASLQSKSARPDIVAARKWQFWHFLLICLQPCVCVCQSQSDVEVEKICATEWSMTATHFRC